MQNESKKINLILLAILELTVIEQIKVNGKVLTSQERKDAISILTLSAGSILGFTDNELLDHLTDTSNDLTHSASELLAGVVIENREHQKHGETRND